MILFSALTFLLVNIIYIKIWNKFLDKVPTGIGVLLIIPCFFFYLEQNINFISITFLIIFSLIYFLDDLIEINFFFRILLQIFASLVIYFSFITEINLMIIFINLVLFLILVNTLNFQDGEDLNIAILLFILFGIFYIYAESNFIKQTSELILIFLISFSFFNIKKFSLYYGDSGCYFISIIIFLFFYNEINNTLLIKLLIATIIFPIIDVFYVIVYRVFKKQNLLSRNYLHLYQILAQKFNNKLYLLPNILFSVLNIFISLNFSLGINFIIFLFIINIFLLFVIHLIVMKMTDKNAN
jgi:UDP-N-acetylmuramyl pentapeptide phosphotransferase/UDP-N-acetylglucosamine-1-phosphate transferase